MKIRKGFVSNSSSTSFSIYGVYVKDSGDALDRLVGKPKETKTPGCKHKFDRKKVKFCSECGEKAWESHVEKRDIDDFEDYFNEAGFDVRAWSGGENCNDGTYVGKDLDDSKFNECKNKLDILREMEGKLIKIFPDREINFYSDGGYDG
ncbi:MAG TPA: hypothetical protein VMV32_05310 [Ignavibacteriaceae bacterium]|nr:hypothetical protein [Ignavibacteriaceae bacterium]